MQSIGHKFTIVLLLTLLVACSEEPAAVKPTPPSKEAKQKIVKTPAVSESVSEVAQKLEPAYAYDPTGRRDPFQSLLKIKRSVVEPGNAPLTPLQKYGIGQLNLVAIVVGKGEPRALVVAPDRKSYVLTKGMKVGENGGEVIDVTLDAVLVEEKFYDFAGDLKKTLREIKLPLPEGGK